MNTEPKSFASLSSGLLARKGAARPAMRPQGFGQVAGLEDLGWNDMGFEPPKPAEAPAPDAEHDGFGDVIPAHPHNLAGLTPVDSPVHSQRAEIEGRLTAFTPDDSGEELDETAELYEPGNGDELQVEEHKLQLVEPEPEAMEAPLPVFEPEPVAMVKPQPLQVAAVRPERVVRRSREPRAAPGTKAKAAFTLRLEPERHLKLRLACAVSGSSAQMLVTQALDEFLGSMPELEAMAVKAKRKG
ncbi:MAG: hypothetical protein H0W39_09990 [Sphingomonas sp.]|nr:hypothetical protein [Sphingomonas sp.]